MSIYSPENRTYYSTTIYVDVSAEDPDTGVEWISITVDGNESYIIANGVRPGWHEISGNTTIILPDGSHNIVAYARAWFTQEVSSAEINFRVDTTSNSKQSEDLLLLAALIVIVVFVVAISMVLLIKRKSTKR